MKTTGLSLLVPEKIVLKQGIHDRLPQKIDILGWALSPQVSDIVIEHSSERALHESEGACFLQGSIPKEIIFCNIQQNSPVNLRVLPEKRLKNDKKSFSVA